MKNLIEPIKDKKQIEAVEKYFANKVYVTNLFGCLAVIRAYVSAIF